MKVLVTGARSLMMGGIAAALVQRGDQVVCLQRTPAEFDGSNEVRQVLADLRDASAIADAVTGCDAVIHGAAKVGVVGTWEEYQKVNVDGTATVLAVAQSAGVARVVYVSTPSVAHVGEALVGGGADPAVVRTNGAHYPRSKAMAEQLALGANSNEMAVMALRPHLVWGPGDTQLVGRIIERARAGRLVMVGDGSALVDSTYVDNAVSAHLAAIDALHIGAACAGRAYVVSNGEPRPVVELIEGICRAAGVEFAPRRVPVSVAKAVGSVVERVWPRLRSGEPPITRFVAEQLATAHWFDQREIRADLNWHPEVSLAEGFARLARWCSANPEAYRSGRH
jgi:nucleoside-diphosphate-sugar epimerase